MKPRSVSPTRRPWLQTVYGTRANSVKGVRQARTDCALEHNHFMAGGTIALHRGVEVLPPPALPFMIHSTLTSPQRNFMRRRYSIVSAGLASLVLAGAPVHAQAPTADSATDPIRQ